MCRRALAALAASALALSLGHALADAPSATAQTLVPNPVCLLGGCDESDRDANHADSKSGDPACSTGATLVCAGKTIVSGLVSRRQQQPHAREMLDLWRHARPGGADDRRRQR
jgi:hypothetical protein